MLQHSTIRAYVGTLTGSTKPRRQRLTWHCRSVCCRPTLPHDMIPRRHHRFTTKLAMLLNRIVPNLLIHGPRKSRAHHTRPHRLRSVTVNKLCLCHTLFAVRNSTPKRLTISPLTNKERFKTAPAPRLPEQMTTTLQPLLEVTTMLVPWPANLPNSRMDEPFLVLLKAEVM